MNIINLLDRKYFLPWVLTITRGKKVDILTRWIVGIKNKENITLTPDKVREASKNFLPATFLNSWLFKTFEKVIGFSKILFKNIKGYSSSRGVEIREGFSEVLQTEQYFSMPSSGCSVFLAIVVLSLKNYRRLCLRL